LVPVANAGQAVLVPAIRPRPRVIVREVAPGIAAGAVVLPDRAPRTLGEVRSPPIPVPFMFPVEDQASAFASIVDRHVRSLVTSSVASGKITLTMYLGRSLARGLLQVAAELEAHG